jgi:hydroxypyruvate isomerase
MLYNELPFSERPAAAKQDGISLIEFWDYRDKNLDLLSRQLDKFAIRVSNISGNRYYGMVDPQEGQHFYNEISETIKIAARLGCPRIMLLVQKLLADGRARQAPVNLTGEQKIEQIIACGRAAGKLAEKWNSEIVIEPLNSKEDHPGYFLDSSSLAFRIIREISHPRVKLLYDIFHMSVMGEDILGDLEDHMNLIGYIHAADWPGRREPGSGEIRYRQIFSHLKRLGYNGIIGFECYPSDGKSTQAVRNILKLI